MRAGLRHGGCKGHLPEEHVGKTHRGKGLKDQKRGGRTECPICKRTAVKVVYEVTVKEKTIKVCKTCKASLANGKKQKEADGVAAAVASAPAAAPAAG